jgi:eukaryotic-like serine/threonine-protein kinase
MNSIRANEMTAVLVINSDYDEALALRKILAENDYRVYAADTPETAQGLMAVKKIHAVLLALKHSDQEPDKFITALTSKKGDPSIPIIVILDRFTEDVAVSALKAGAADFLTFPVKSQELIERVGVQIRMFSPESKSKRGGFLTGLSVRFLSGLFPKSRTQEVIGGHYEKLGRLGIGSFGEVWKVRDMEEKPPSLYVAKIPLSKNFNAKIEKEAHILKRLSNHSCVPKFREIIEEKNITILIQEFVVGKTLYEVIERELTNKEVESVVIQLADVVAHAHNLGIIHRDIKPGNVMVKPDGTIMLLDFGAAKELKGKTFSETVTGSRPYMSPEQIMGKSQRRSDVWAIGVVMYVLYTGMFPFYHEVEKILMDMILEIPPSFPSKFNEDLNQEIERIIMKCLRKNPNDRYSDANALKEDLIASVPDYGKLILPLYKSDDPSSLSELRRGKQGPEV